MSSLHHSVTKAFGVPGVIREKGYYKTIDGAKIIYKTTDGRDQILARHQITEHCIKTGYPWMDRYHLSKGGQPYVFAEGEYYVMTDRIPYREADFSNPHEFLKIVDALANWHRCARRVAFTGSLYKGHPPASLTETFYSQGNMMDSIRKRIRKQSKWSDFDVMFLKNYLHYRERMQRALQLLESTGYLNHCHKARQKGHICHGDLKGDCLRIYGDRVYITKLGQAFVDYQLSDLCDIIRRREKGQQDLKHSLILDTYSQVLPLEPEEEVILEAILLYPAAFVKTATEYYQKKRTWTPAAITNKMREILSDEGIT